jgi:hypothetical protein
MFLESDSIIPQEFQLLKKRNYIHRFFHIRIITMEIISYILGLPNKQISSANSVIYKLREFSRLSRRWGPLL